MNATQLSNPEFITTSKDLRRLSKTLHREKVLAVDTESNSLFAYREQVCLIQFSTVQADYLVDPLVLDDLSPLGDLFSDPSIEKVFHAAEYDLLCLKRDFGFSFANLFDTMIACRILGRELVGLGAILENEFHIHIDKRHQRANWGQRPLPLHLLEYARFDTHYLIPLRDRLLAELLQRGLIPLAKEDFQRICCLKPNSEKAMPGEGKVVDCWRIHGASDLTPQQAAVLQELCRYRDKVARLSNRPTFKVMNDRTLLSIAMHLPNSLETLGELPGMSPGQLQRHGAQLLRAVQRGLNAPPPPKPHSPRPDDHYLRRLEALRNWRKKTAQAMGVASDVVLPRDLLGALALHNPSSMEELSAILSEVPWRLEHFGGQILEVLRQKRGA